ncbi:MAG TPA: outer membrane beta-barrel protein [Thermoanaerobaculia bacterium]|nr:outer membrane beta-barrel protein [Thermoanaerobaculia bacterium]
MSSTRHTQSFAMLGPIAAALALALLGAPRLVAQEPPTLVEQAQAQLAQAQAQLAQAQQQLERALALAQQAQAQAGVAPAQVKVGAGSASVQTGVEPAPVKTAAAETAPAKTVGHESPAAVVQALLRTQPEPVVASPPTLTSKAAVPVKPKAAEPFSFADFTWLNGNSRTSESPIDTKVFTGEFRVDVSEINDFNHPRDNTLVGSSESGRTNEIQLQQLGIGGDFHYNNVIGRLMTQFGMYSTMTPRNDASPGRGQWDLADAYRYLSEAYGGYHWDVLNGINLEAGIFMSYVGLFSYYNFDNWTYQPSYVSSNTPWFFNGLRVQIFPSDHLKIEPWYINGWQSYGKFNSKPGLGMQVLWRPNGAVEVLSNNYGVGTDTLGNPNRTRWHTDDSIEVKYYDRPERFLDKMAFSITADAGCESGGGVHCATSSPGTPSQYFLGYMVYNRFWFDGDRFAMTVGGGQITNPGRYLVLLPPINGATAFSGTPYFPENPGDPYRAYDGSITFDWMPSQFITFRTELDRRGANVPYFAGPGGVTPPFGNSGPPGSFVQGFTPDLRKTETRINTAVLVKF